MKNFIYIFCFVFFLSEIQAQTIEQLSAQQWEEDIEFLQEKLFETLPEADKRIDNSLFLKKKNDLKAKLSSLSTKEIIVGMQSLLALANEDGCYIYPFQPSLNFQLLPLKNYWFSDGMYVCDAAEPYKQLIGQQIVKVNGVNIENIFDKLKPVLPADNENYQRYIFPLYFQISAWLKWAGILEDSNSVVLTTSSGMEKKVLFGPVQSYIPLKRELANFRKIADSKKEHKDENYWMEYLPGKQTIFIQFLQIPDNKKGESFNSFVKAVEKKLNSKNVAKLIIDNRYGGGGNGFKLKPFTNLIRDNKSINQKGKLFVLTSRSTRGTVLEMTSVLANNTKVILVGEPTGEGPNLVGDTKQVILPNSKIRVSLTHIFWPTSFDSDSRNTIEPSENIEYKYTDYMKGNDPWLSSIESLKQAEAPGKEIPKEIAKSLFGRHTISKRTLEVVDENGRIFLKMNRKIKSFFELKIELFFLKVGVLSTDISGVQLFYQTNSNGKSIIKKIEWFGEKLE